MPIAAERPIPSDPPGNSTPGTLWSGWPCRRLFIFRRVLSSLVGRYPASARVVEQDWRSVSFRQNEPVTIWPIRTLRVVPHLVEEQRDKDLDGRKASAWVAGLCLRHHLKNMGSDLCGFLQKHTDGDRLLFHDQ